MKDWLVILVIFVIWVILQFVVFPKLGVPS